MKSTRTQGQHTNTKIDDTKRQAPDENIFYILMFFFQK